LLSESEAVEALDIWKAIRELDAEQT